MRIFLLIIFLILTNCTIANVVPLVIEERNNKNNIELIEKLIEEADSSKKSRWRWGHELIELTPRSSTKRVIRINLQAVCPALNVIPAKAIVAGPVDS